MCSDWSVKLKPCTKFKVSVKATVKFIRACMHVFVPMFIWIWGVHFETNDFFSIDQLKKKEINFQKQKIRMEMTWKSVFKSQLDKDQILCRIYVPICYKMPLSFAFYKISWFDSFLWLWHFSLFWIHVYCMEMCRICTSIQSHTHT